MRRKGRVPARSCVLSMSEHHCRHPEPSMPRPFSRLILATTVVAGVAACADLTSTSPSDLTLSALTAALSSVPVGYGDLSSSYIGVSAANANAAGLWIGGGREAEFHRDGLMG